MHVRLNLQKNTKKNLRVYIVHSLWSTSHKACSYSLVSYIVCIIVWIFHNWLDVEAHITVSCTTEYPAYKSDEASKCWGLVTLKASDYEPEESKRPTLDIVAVIDRSGSMNGEKLFLVKKSLKFLVQNCKFDNLDKICFIPRECSINPKSIAVWSIYELRYR